ncbi:MAG: 2-hydroxychromene-2-carboxylate isomerase [Magnetospiraceae bacterium]
MAPSIPVEFYFNFRSPYCYLVSRRIWDLFEDFPVQVLWRPLGGWSGRSDPERAKVKIPLARQDIKRWAEKLDLPMVPPPPETDPTHAGAVSLLAERQGCLKEYMVTVMHAAWGAGKDIGDLDVLCDVAAGIGMEPAAVSQAATDPENQRLLTANAAIAAQKGIFGVPTFAVGDQYFWGNDRLDFLRDHLMRLQQQNVAE